MSQDAEPNADSSWQRRAVDRSLGTARARAVSRSGQILAAARELTEETLAPSEQAADRPHTRVTRIMATEHAAEAAELRARAAPDARDLDPATVRDAPRADAWRGLHAFAAWLEARRSVLHDAFLRQWTDLGRAGFRARLEYALAERAPEPPAPDPEPALAARTEP